MSKVKAHCGVVDRPSSRIRCFPNLALAYRLWIRIGPAGLNLNIMLCKRRVIYFSPFFQSFSRSIQMYLSPFGESFIKNFRPSVTISGVSIDNNRRDWTIESRMEDPLDSELFTDDYYGTSMGYEDNYVVNSSFMAYFPINSDPMNISGVTWESPYGYMRSTSNYNPSAYVTRCKGKGTLPTTTTFNKCLSQQNYSTFWICTWWVPRLGSVRVSCV